MNARDTQPSKILIAEEAEAFRLNALRTLIMTLATFTPRQEFIIRFRLGFDKEHFQKLGIHTIEDLASSLGISVSTVFYHERRVITGLLNEPRVSGLRKAGINPDALFKGRRKRTSIDYRKERKRIEAAEQVVATVDRLTPELIVHLRHHHSDLIDIPAEIFEHLVAEFFASWGWDEVRHVGRNSETSADILVGRFDDNLNERVRYFVEVKRWRQRIGIEVINQVLGAMIDERPKFGWHAAMIVTVSGPKEFRKYSREELRLKGIWIKDKLDVDRWLQDYEPSPSGLWLPSKHIMRGDTGENFVQ